MLAVSDHVMPGPAHHAHVVDAAVLEELAVFNGQNSLYDMWRNFVVFEQPSLGAIDVITKTGNQLRLQLIAGERLPVIVTDRRNLPAADVNRCAILRVK